MRTLLKYSAFLMIAAFFLGTVSGYTTQIHAPAVLLSENQGVLTVIQLNLTQGNGNVSISGPSKVGNSTLQSAITAASYASKYLGVNESNYNFSYTIEDNGSDVSGPSGGLALTLLAISALEHTQLRGNFTVTGTISPSGLVGQVGGVYDKLNAAKRYGMRFALIPSASQQSIEYLIYYIAQQEFRIPVVEVSNASQALPYATDKYTPKITPLALNFSSDYKLKGLPMAPVNCSDCNMSYFRQLINFTFGMLSNSTNLISGNLSVVKPQIDSQLRIYENISGKGYLYQGADLAFLQYPTVFTLMNSGNYSVQGANNIFNNVYSYCSSLTPPNMTTANYEYVVGGQLRQEWAMQNLAEIHSFINASNTTDDVIFGLNNIAPSYAWCRSTSEMYHIAGEIGGTPMGYSSKLKSEALAAIDRANASGTAVPLYLLAAESAYNSSQYPAAIFGADYSVSFSANVNPSINNTELLSMINANAANSTYGIWSSEFANSAMFAAYQANLTGGNETYNLTSAYVTSELAANLANAEEETASGLVPINESIANVLTQNTQTATTQPENSTAITSIEYQLNQIYSVLLILVIIVAILALILFFILIRLFRLGNENIRNTARNTNSRAASQKRKV